MNYFEIDDFDKFIVHQDNVKLANCVFSGSSADGLIIYSNGQVNVQTCVFTRNRYSFKWTSAVQIAVLDCEFRSNTYGMRGVYGTDVMVSECTFVETSLHSALYMTYGGRGRFTLQNSLFQKNDYSIRLDTGSPNDIRIRGNVFRNETRGAVIKIIEYATNLLVENNTFSDLPSAAIYIQQYSRDNKHTTIRTNTFLRIKGIQINIRNADYANVTVEKNMFLNNQPSATTAGIYMKFSDRMSGRISQNEFRNNGGTNIIYVTVYRQSSYYSHVLDITSNLFYDNVASQAVVVTNTELCTMTGNIFSNVLSAFDLLVTFANNNLTAPYNWWGAADEDHVRRRIWDKSDDSNLGLVLYEPFLTKTDISCNEVANCSGHVVCVLPNMCECQSGWTGQGCNQFTCAEYSNCRNLGVCVGPNMCDCDDGRMTPDCSGNRFAPTFTEGDYSLTLQETTDTGTTVMRVSAEDLDSTVLVFTIVSGNTGNVFSLKPFSGTADLSDLLLPLRK